MTALLLLAALISMPAHAQSGHQQISETVHKFLADHYLESDAVEIEVSGIDPRLQIAACDNELQPRLHQSQSQAPVGKVTVRVDCAGANPWTRYIAANVRVFRLILQTTRPLPRGTIVSPQDIELAEVDIASIRTGWVQEQELVIGKALRRALPAGAPVAPEALLEPQLIKRGETVVLSAQRGSVLIRQTGIAMQNGELGRQIGVRNTASDRVVQAVVTGPGQAEVLF